MAFQLPQSRIPISPIQLTKRRVPIEQIVAVRGQNPWAEGIQEVGKGLANVITQRGLLRRQGTQLARMESLYGLNPGELSNLDVNTGETIGKYLAENRKPTYINKVNEDGTTELIEIPAGGKFGGSIKMGGGAENKTTSTQFVDEYDNMPLLKKGNGFIRGDGSRKPSIGKPIPVKGNAEAVTSSSRGSEIYTKIDPFFEKLKSMDYIDRAKNLAPGVRNVFYPELNQVINELKQVGFSFGGKNYTGTEAAIIMGALIPNSLDNNESLNNKQVALKGYIGKNINLLQAGNLLGPAGQPILDIINKDRNLKNNNLSSLPSPVPTISPLPTPGRIRAWNEKTGRVE